MRNALCCPGNLRQVVKLARSRNLTCQLKAAYSIANIAKLPPNRAAIANEQGIEPLISMTRCPGWAGRCNWALNLALYMMAAWWLHGGYMIGTLWLHYAGWIM